jgi:hypothetical protein
MSRNVQATKKPHCKVCFDAGKPESEYTGHWVRSLPDRNGKTTVTCPTLLNTECRYCYQSGHTTKFCPSIKQNVKEIERTKRAEVVEKKTKPKIQEKKRVSVYAALMDSDSEDDEEKVRPVENFPELCVNVKEIEVEKQEVKTGWAAIVAKPAEVKKVVEPTKVTGLVLLSDFIKPEPKVNENKPAPWANNKKPVITKSWADESDTEDETEDEYIPYAEEVDATW